MGFNSGLKGLKNNVLRSSNMRTVNHSRTVRRGSKRQVSCDEILLSRKPESVGLLSATLHRNIILSVILCMGMKLGLSQEGKNTHRGFLSDVDIRTTKYRKQQISRRESTCSWNYQHCETRQDKTRQDKTRQDKTRQDKTRPEEKH